MRKTTIALGLGLALSLGAGDLTAQGRTRADSGKARAEQGQRGARAEGAPGMRGNFARGQGVLLKGITLTDAQKAQLKSQREQQNEARKATRESGKDSFEDARAARQRGDTAALRTMRATQQARMEQQRQQEIAAIRSILTAEQRVQFDRNVAELETRGQNRAAGARQQNRRRAPRA